MSHSDLKNKTNTKIKNSIWIIFSFIVFLNGIGFVYIGYKTSNKKWIKKRIVHKTTTNSTRKETHFDDYKQQLI